MKKQLLTLMTTLTLATICIMPHSVFASSLPAANAISGAQGISTKAIQLGLNGYRWAMKHHDVKKKGILTVIDYTLPSYKKRLIVIDLKTSKVILRTRVAHGKNSGLTYSTRFSNKSGTDMTSLGIIQAANTYYGEHGLSMRLHGLEKGINNNMNSRAVVMHSAWYASPKFVAKTGYLGRSWGCMAVSPTIKNQLIHLVSGGSIIFSYAKPELRDANVNGTDAA